MNLNAGIHIIAEIAQGYEGKPILAELLTTGGISSEADAIKFQLVYADELATPDYKYYDLFKSLEMDISVWTAISQRIKQNGIKLYFDIFGVRSLEVAAQLKADGVKLSTTEFFNRPLMNHALLTFDTVFLSIGGIETTDIDALMNDVLKKYMAKVCLMYGFQSEPTALEKNNLARLRKLKERYPGFAIGFMDHSDGGTEDAHLLSLVSIGAGVSVIEKHLTLDRELKIEDFISGVSPNGFREFTRLAKKFEFAMGSESLELTEEEHAYRSKAGKVVVAIKDIEAGQKVGNSDVALKRSGSVGDKVPYKRLEEVIGATAKKRVAENAPVLRGEI